MKDSRIKRFIGLFISVVLIFGSGTAVFAADTFSDLTDGKCKEAVDFLVAEKVITGYEDGTFRPDNSITRAEICVAISKAMDPGDKKYASAKDNGFLDVGSNYDWAKKYINYASAMGAVDGYPDGTFKPAGNITYNELSAMVLKAMGYKASELQGVWPQNFKNKALDLKLYEGIMEGLTKEETASFDYEAEAPRGDCMIMIEAAFEKLQEMGQSDIPQENVSTEIPPYYEGDYDWISGEEVELSIADAVKIMQEEGYLAEMAELNNKSDKAIANGYASNEKTLEEGLAMLEGLLQQESQLKAAIEAAGGSESALDLAAQLATVQSTISTMEKSGVTKANEKMVSLQRQFAKAHIDDNLEADMNNIEYQTVSLYYGVLQAEENLAVCEENLELQRKILKNTELKYSVGTATALEVKAQQASVTAAEQDVNTAKSAAEKAKMNFNMLLGFDIDTNLILTDELTPKGKPDVDLEKAVKDAMKNRLSVAQLDYACEIQKIALSQVSGTSAYSQQRAALKITELAYDNMPNTIAIEIRSAYIDLNDKYNTVLESQETVAMARESLRVAELMYEVGMNTSADVQKAQITARQANQLLMASISDYNLACYAFDYMTGVGKERIEL